jgi:hypothetical protein
MKILKYFTIFSLLAVIAASCEKGIDPISPADMGTDQTAPTLVINYPPEGKVVISNDAIATVTFKLVAVDDHELQSVKISLDGTEIGNLTSFKDYRRAVVNQVYNSLADGDHVLSATATDLTGKTVSAEVHFKKITAPPYEPMDGEVLYLPFDENLLDLISGNEVSAEGTPGYAEGKIGSAYAGAADTYITNPSSIFTGTQFSVAFWYKINADPLRAGIISISPDEGESRSVGFRLFRENNGANQNIGLNFGIGANEAWINPFITVPPDHDWMHIAITISNTKAFVYIDDVVAKEFDMETVLSWTGCTLMSIASGEPNFVYWQHLSDLSLYDDMHFFNKAISADDVHKLFTAK